MTHSGTLIRICIDSYLTLIYNSLELILYLSVKNFTKVFCSETCCKSIIADTDTEHIPLSCVIYTFNAVYIIVEFTLDNRFKIRLHLLTSYFYHVGKAVLASRFEAIDFRTYDSNLVILDLVHFLSLHKLYAVHTGTVKFHTAEETCLERNRVMTRSCSSRVRVILRPSFDRISISGMLMAGPIAST